MSKQDKPRYALLAGDDEYLCSHYSLAWIRAQHEKHTDSIIVVKEDGVWRDLDLPIRTRQQMEDELLNSME